MIKSNIMNDYEPHKTEKIELKGILADIDCKIIPIIKWFNKFDSVQTFFSCEGRVLHKNGKTTFLSPYVTFTSNLEDLRLITIELQPKNGKMWYATIDVSLPHNTNEFLTFSVYFESIEKRDLFTQQISQGNQVKFD